ADISSIFTKTLGNASPMSRAMSALQNIQGPIWDADAGQITREGKAFLAELTGGVPYSTFSKAAGETLQAAKGKMDLLREKKRRLNSKNISEEEKKKLKKEVAKLEGE